MNYALIYTEIDNYCEIDNRVPYQKVTLYETKELARKAMKEQLEDLTDEPFEEYRKALEEESTSKVRVTDEEAYIVDGFGNNPVIQTWNIVEVS